MTGDLKPLDGVRVLDLTHTLAGPLCTRILADLGADVVKVEGPTGDQVRPFPPVVDGTSAFFHHFNAGKRSVCVDIRDPAGADLVARLATRADVLVENWRPGALARRGLGADVLRVGQPRPDLLLDHRMGPDRTVGPAPGLRPAGARRGGDGRGVSPPAAPVRRARRSCSRPTCTAGWRR